MSRKIAIVILSVFLLGVLNFAGQIGNVKAAVQDFHLYGSYTSGWGFSSGSETSPGPVITVNFGDTVNLTLTNEDTTTYHQFLLSYHNSSIPLTGDPESDIISAGATIVFTFTANVSTGTFTYFCIVHPGTMFGTFVVTPAIPEFPSMIVLSIFMLGTIAIVVFWRRKRLTA